MRGECGDVPRTQPHDTAKHTAFGGVWPGGLRGGERPAGLNLSGGGGGDARASAAAWRP